MINFLTKKRYYVVFCILENSSYSIIKKKRINVKRKTIRYDKKTFPIDVEKPLYIKNNKLFYFFNFKSGNQLLFEKDKSRINVELIDSILSEKIVSQLTANLNDTWKLNTMVFLFGVILGVCIGYIAYPFVYNYVNKETVETTEGILINSLITIF